VANRPRPLEERLSKRAPLERAALEELVMLKAWVLLEAVPEKGRVRPGALCQVPTPLAFAVRTWPAVAEEPSWKAPTVIWPERLALPDCGEPGAVDWSRTVSGVPVMLDQGML
jgi:hypothetical protein